MSAEALIREALERLSRTVTFDGRSESAIELEKRTILAPAFAALAALTAERDGWIADCSIAEENARTALEAAGRARETLNKARRDLEKETDLGALQALSTIRQALARERAALGEPVCPPGEGSACADSTTAKGTGSPNVKDPGGSEAASESEKT